MTGPKQLDAWGLLAWSALEETNVGGWLLRFAGGHTKRSNAVYPLAHPQVGLDRAIERCQGVYVERRLPTIFRMTAKCHPPELDRALKERGFASIDRTWVLCRDLEGTPLPTSEGAAASIEAVSCGAWLDAYEELELLDPPAMSLRRRIIEGTRGEAIPLLAMDGERLAGLNLGIRTGGGLGLFCLHVREDARRRGIGRQLVEATLRAGFDAGARTAYLQVEETNDPARQLYEMCGFVPSHVYWYRVGP